MKNEIPCKECICLPICAAKAKEVEKTCAVNFNVLIFSNRTLKCNLLHSYLNDTLRLEKCNYADTKLELLKLFNVDLKLCL